MDEARHAEDAGVLGRAAGLGEVQVVLGFGDEQFDVVVAGLDNIKARLYVDGRCVFFEKPLLESGTMGTSGNVDTVAPGKTRTYRDGGNAAAGGGIPMCTLRNFPHLTDHCIEWARDQFAANFVKLPKTAPSPWKSLTSLRRSTRL